MSDIVERLREEADKRSRWLIKANLMLEAADEINRLREALEKAAQTAEQWGWCGYGKDICGPKIAAVIRAALAKEAGK